MNVAHTAIFPETASTSAAAFNHLLLFLICICAPVVILVWSMLIGFSIRYRRRPGQEGNPPQMKESHALEWFWTLAPLVIFTFVFLWGAKVYFDMFDAPKDAVPVYVVGKQWMWKIQHVEGQREINTLHVPLGQPIKLLMTSEDVIHDFYIPAFRIHMDVLPDRYTSYWFKATQVGEFHLFCGQYCGPSHSGMVGKIIVMEPADYQRWAARVAEGSLALKGRQVFLKYRCVACHSADHDARAPVLEALYGSRVHLQDGQTVIADENYIRTSILQPSRQIVAGWENIMPSFRNDVNEEEIAALIVYIQSLKPGKTPRRVESFPPPRTTPPVEPDDISPTKEP